MLGKEVMITKSLANTALARYSIEATVSISLQNIRLSFIETSSENDCKKRGEADNFHNLRCERISCLTGEQVDSISVGQYF